MQARFRGSSQSLEKRVLAIVESPDIACSLGSLIGPSLSRIAALFLSWKSRGRSNQDPGPSTVKSCF
jgi:hypothetical protein